MQTKWIQIIKMLSFVIAFFVYIRKMKGEYSKNEIDIILDRFKDDDTFTCAFITSCFTGMRTGEVCVLTWDKVDLEKRIISIEHNVYSKVKDEKGKQLLLPGIPEVIKEIDLEKEKIIVHILKGLV